LTSRIAGVTCIARWGNSQFIGAKLKKESNAICIINSWLKSKNVKCIKSKDEILIGRYPMPQIFVVQHKVRLTSSANEYRDNTFFINTNDILSSDNKTSQKAVNFIFKKLYNKEAQFVRTGNTPKAFYQDDFEGAYLRHTDFNRSPNVPKEEIKKYDPVIKSEAKKAFNKFNRLVYQAGFQIEDLYNIGLVYLISFLHKHNQEDDSSNKKLLRIYLRQRYGHFAETVFRKHKNAMSNNMFVSEEHHTAFRNELKLQNEMLNEINCSEIPEYDNQDLNILFNGTKTKLCIRAKGNQPKYWINNKEFKQKQLTEMISQGIIQGF
jgi:hypothetical protein